MPVTVETTVSRMPRPVPIHFSHAEQSFSLKKRRVPVSTSSTSNSTCSSPARLSLSLPPQPPSKGCPPLSRMFPQQPSPWTPLSFSLAKSPPPNSVYDPSKQQSYFNQCFTNLGLLGRGSFGEVYKVNKKKTRLSCMVNIYLPDGDLPVGFFTVTSNKVFFVFCFFLRCKATRTAASMLSNVLLIALGETVRGTAVWGKPGTTNSCVLILTSWILCLPGKNVDGCTFRQSCAAPACCFMLRTSRTAWVSHKYSVITIEMVTCLCFVLYFLQTFLESSDVSEYCTQTFLQMSPQLGATCATSCRRWNTCILVALCTWIWNLLMSSWLPLGASGWEISDCSLSWNTTMAMARGPKWKRTCRRGIPGTWPPSYSEGNTGQRQTFSGMREKHLKRASYGLHSN